MARNPTSSVNFKPAASNPEQGRVELAGVSIVAARAPATEPYEFNFSSERHAVILSLKGSRTAGVTQLEGTRPCDSLVFRDTCLVVPAGANLSGWSAPREVHEYVAVTFDPALPSSLEGKLSAATIRSELCFEDRLLSAAARELYQEASNATDFGRLWTDALTNLVVARLLRRCAGPSAARRPARGGLGAFQLRLVTEYLQDHLGENASLPDLAALAGLSVSHFSRAFRVSTGMPPHLWLRWRRIERAQSLLRSSERSISEIAGVCGFSDQSHLTKVFRALTGVTPLQWRRDGRGKQMEP